MYSHSKKYALRKSKLALSLSVILFSSSALSDTIKVEAESFFNSGGTFNDNQPTPVTIYTVNGQNAISYVNVGDFVDYNISTDGGQYSIEYSVGTNVASGPTIEVLVNSNGNWVSQGTVSVPQTGWDNFQPLTPPHKVTLPAGSSTIRLHAIGSNWQWNMESFTLTQESTAGYGPVLESSITIPANRKIQRSSVWYTYPQNSNLAAFDNFGASGAFWGHMQDQNGNKDIYDPAMLSNWVDDVQAFRDQGFNYMGRGEFDWGYSWFTDYAGNPTSHWARTLDNNIITMTFMGPPANHMHNGYPNGWLSNHSPLFVDYFKSQVDALLSANISHMMFDSQTSSTRSTDLGQFGGDFSTRAMNGFRAYMRDKYTNAELSAKGINNINNFNYRTFLLNKNYTHATYTAAANRITSGIPLFDDFIYFNRDVLNEKMAEVFDYVRSKDATIEIGATTALSEARGYIFDKDITFLAGELGMASGAANAHEMPIPIITHLKNAEAVGKTLIYFPYPFDFKNLYDRNSPAMARTWIAQSYAMGAIFSIPANVWLNDSVGVWSPGADNYRDLYQFADNNSNLLDGYDAYSKVGLVAPMMASLDAEWINGSNNHQSSIRRLIESNLNFDTLPFGDPGYAFVPSQGKLDSLDAIITDADSGFLTAEQNALLNANSSKVINITNTGAINALKASNISVTINSSAADATVTALSRVHKTDNNAPYVIHLLNRPVNPANGTTSVVNNVSVAIPQGYFSENITGATIRFPGGASYPLGLSSNSAGDTILDLSGLGVWGILELNH